MEMESSSTWVVDTSLDLNINSYFKNLQQDHHHHHVPALPHHKNDFIFQENLANLDQVCNEESTLKEESSDLWVKEFNRISSENQKLTEMLTCMCDKYNVLQTHFLELKDKNNSLISDNNKQVVTTMKRKAPTNDHCHGLSSSAPIHMITNGVNESSSSDHEDTNINSKRQKQEDVIKNKVSRVLVRTDASNMNSLVVKDGYQWRKYGQKVTRDNPSPRAYFKCSFAPTCPVKKKVQRSFENPSVLVATYEGEHNHLQPCRAEFTFSTNQGQASTINVHGSGSMNPSSTPTSVTTLDHDLVQPQTNNININNQEAAGTEPAIFQRFLVQQMATSLTKDPNFTAALAAAISGRFLDHAASNV